MQGAGGERASLTPAASAPSRGPASAAAPRPITERRAALGNRLALYLRGTYPSARAPHENGLLLLIEDAVAVSHLADQHHGHLRDHDLFENDVDRYPSMGGRQHG